MEELGAIEPQKGFPPPFLSSTHSYRASATLVSSNGNQAATKPTASTLVGDLDNLMVPHSVCIDTPDSPVSRPSVSGWP